MSWHIAKINNATHKVMLQRDDGHSVDVVIPDDHTHSSQAKMEWIKAQMILHDRFPKKPEQIAPITSDGHIPILSVLVAFNTIAILAIMIARLMRWI